MYWNELANTPVNNPTKSVPVNDLIKRLKNKEVQKQGKDFVPHKPFTKQEYKGVIIKMDRHYNVEVGLFLSSIFILH